jgi:phage-related protein
MNEEQLKIVIRTIAEQTHKELEKVKKELQQVEKQGKETEKIAESFKKVAKQAAVAATGITALVAGMVKLGNESLNIQKIYGRLEAGFASTGQSAEQAHSVFKGLYRFLGDDEAALEAANLMAQLTGEMEHQKEWITILQGAYAKLPFSITTESLIESINETVKVGKVVGQTADALNWLKVSEDEVNAALANLNSETEREAYLRSLLLGLYEGAAVSYERTNGGVMAYYESQANLNSVLASTSSFMIPLLTSLNNMAATLLQVLSPAIQFVSQVLVVFIRWIIAAANAINSLFGGSSSKIEQTTTSMSGFSSSVGNASSGMNNLGKGIDSATKKAKELRKITMGFDELNVVNPPSTASGASGAGVGGVGGASVPAVEIPSIPDLSESMGLDDFYEGLEEVEERIEGILVLVGLVAGGLAAWKILDTITDPAINLKNLFKDIGSYALIIGGALLLVQGYSDAWANGIDWGNFAMIIAGVAMVVGGLAMKFGNLGGGIGLVVGGIAMVVLGIKDFVENGYSMEAVITITVGAIAILIGVIWAMNAALLANPITWVVVAIMALVGAFVILWNECEGFRQFWIDLWEKIKVAFAAVVEWFKQAGKNIAQFFVDAWNKIKETWSKVKDWFSNVWQGIKNVFSVVGSWFSDIFGKAWNGIKNAFSKVGSFFSGIWNTIKDIFSKVGSTIGNAVSGAFSKAINWVLEKAIGIINGFIGAINTAIGIINKIPGVNITKLSKLDVPKLATGGILTAESLFIGCEGGKKEAVLPLEQNTEWMDILADRINQRNSTPSRIVLMLDKKELGWANIDSINDITKQTGNLQLSLV